MAAGKDAVERAVFQSSLRPKDHSVVKYRPQEDDGDAVRVSGMNAIHAPGKDLDEGRVVADSPDDEGAAGPSAATMNADSRQGVDTYSDIPDTSGDDQSRDSSGSGTLEDQLEVSKIAGPSSSYGMHSSGSDNESRDSGIRRMGENYAGLHLPEMKDEADDHLQINDDCLFQSGKSGAVGENPIFCNLCGKAFDCKNCLIRHDRVHVHERAALHTELRCDICFKLFKEKRNLFEHLRIHTGETPFVCDLCGKGFNRKSGLKSHNLIHTQEKPYRCEVCDKAYTRRSNLRNHKCERRSKHECPICFEALADEKQRKYHLNIHAKEKAILCETYKCELCGKIVNCQRSLTEHMRTHTGEKPFTCKVCGKTFMRRKGLKSHSFTHVVDKPFKCTVCSKSFRKEKELENHSTTHLNLKPYTCNVCLKSYSSKSYLMTHMRIHDPDKPFKCDFCPKAFIVRTQLEDHRRIHTGDKPYQCKLCPKACTTGSNLRSHMKRHHKVVKTKAETPILNDQPNSPDSPPE